MKKKILLFIASALIFSSCDDLFEPALENQQGTEQMYDDPEYARGILHNVYSLIPGYYDNSEYATDDACLLYTSPSPRDYAASRMPSSA